MNMSRDPNTTSPLGAIEGEDTMKLPVKELCQRRCDTRADYANNDIHDAVRRQSVGDDSNRRKSQNDL
jgi:hypothetical protein